MTSLNDVLLAMSNIPVDDPIAEIWGRGLQGGGYTIIEYTGTLPITINATNGNALLDYHIYGNTEQTGTPTPENPILPIGCGEKVDITGLSEPLYGLNTYIDSLDLSTGTLTRRVYKTRLVNPASVTKVNNSYRVYFSISSHPALSYTSGGGVCNIAKWNGDYNNIGFVVSTVRVYITQDMTEWATNEEATVWFNEHEVYIWYVLAEPEVSTISVPPGLTGTIEGYLIQDGTPTPETPIYPTANGVKQADGTYSIPYGYKLPILSNSSITNIYLGEVQTTRRIKKFEFTGNETISLRAEFANATAYSYTHYTDDALPYSIVPVMCSHFPFLASYGDQSDHIYQDVRNFYITSTQYRTVADFKAYLAAQYAAGTPVTVWYVLSEPETGIVNEPLMKIGDYADTVSMEQAGVSIPTNKGTTVIDYDGTTKPSEMYIKFGGKK